MRTIEKCAPKTLFRPFSPATYRTIYQTAQPKAFVQLGENRVPPTLTVPILSQMVPDGFSYGGNYLVEFEPDSLWYETSLTITAHALKSQMRTEYHTFQHIPAEVRVSLSRLGIDLGKMEKQGIFKLIDAYTPATGLPLQAESDVDAAGVKGSGFHKSSWLEEITAGMVKLITEGCPEHAKNWLHIDDNTSIWNRYSGEKELLEIFQTRIIPLMRVRESIAFHSHMAGAASDSFCRQFRGQCDGIIEFVGREEDGLHEQYVRVKSVRGKTCDSRWRRLKLSKSGEVVLDPKPLEAMAKELGIGGWLKGPQKERS